MEKCLLQALNEAKGKILDDDSVITTLETLKQEAAITSKKVEETDKVIAEIETVSLQYKPLSQVRRLIFYLYDWGLNKTKKMFISNEFKVFNLPFRVSLHTLLRL